MEKQIRFIDSNYNELFIIPDGSNIVLTFSDGSEAVRKCKYIDDYHTNVGGYDYHICEFAEKMERNGTTYSSETEHEIVTGYHITERKPVGNKVYVLGVNPNAVKPFVTWVKHAGRDGYDWGHYFSTRSDAYSDLICRASEDAPRPVLLHKDKGQER